MVVKWPAACCQLGIREKLSIFGKIHLTRFMYYYIIIIKYRRLFQIEVSMVPQLETFTTNPKLFKEKAELLKVLAHPVRLCIVRGLMAQDECNVSHIQSCLDMPQSTISQHLAKLRGAGIIEGRRCGLQVYYSVINKDARKIVRVLFS
jgi:DNA-binding transcriptional ArsR family regulator